jgi:ABC-type multidrug transport system fused ATPase/permease subunit
MNDEPKQQSASDNAKKVKHPVFEAVALVLLSLATVGTAWCSFQAAVWSGVSQRTMNMSAAANRRSVTAQLQAYQFSMLDVMLFSEYVNARANSNEQLANFYAQRFRAEAKTAFEKWIAMQPFQNSNAPPHPFVTNLYKPQLLQQAQAEEQQSQVLWQKAGEAGKNSRNYVLLTVSLAAALFFAGAASKFQTGWIHVCVLVLGLCAFLFAAIRLLFLPVQL